MFILDKRFKTGGLIRNIFIVFNFSSSSLWFTLLYKCLIHNLRILTLRIIHCLIIPSVLFILTSSFSYFSDGVSDSQFLDVLNDELLCLKTAIYQLDQFYDPTISYVVVQKRHHTRFIERDMKRWEIFSDIMKDAKRISDVCNA